jgi:hypothetical protein
MDLRPKWGTQSLRPAFKKKKQLLESYLVEHMTLHCYIFRHSVNGPGTGAVCDHRTSKFLSRGEESMAGHVV